MMIKSKILNLLLNDYNLNNGILRELKIEIVWMYPIQQIGK